MEKMKSPKITIVTPSYNQGKYIERTIQSVISQDYSNSEFIICDGGSNDDTVEIIKKYADNIAWWCSEKDEGQADAINKGMKKATGDIVIYLNSDDVLLPGALRTVANYFERHPETDLLNGDVAEITADDKFICRVMFLNDARMFKSGCYNICQQAMFWRRDVFEKIGYFDKSFHATMDKEFLIRVFEGGLKIVHINKVLGAIRIYAETKTAQGIPAFKTDNDKIWERWHGYVRHRSGFNFFVYRLKRFFLGYPIMTLWFYLKWRGRDWRTKV